MKHFALTRNRSTLLLEDYGDNFILRIKLDPGMTDEFELDMRDLIFLRAELTAIIEEKFDEED